ncbi:MAG: hypothetical protein IT205_07950 [Fimbriimonadaceae bacterium]|nr:hypothetical protein [Fimbriimonadaceae bacterium]
MKDKRSQFDRYAIRSVYEFGKKKDGSTIFEERVVFFHAETEEKAYALAEQENEEYCATLGFRSHDEMVAYYLDPMDLPNGTELWSELFKFNGTLEECYEAKYKNFEYSPDSVD